MALAHMLKRSFDITFICSSIPESMQQEVVSDGFSLKMLTKESDFFDLINNDTIIVLDGYTFGPDYQKQIKARGAKLVCIDDLHEKEFFADLIINHAPGITPQEYKVQPYTQFALGLEYALLRPAFLKQAEKQRTIRKIETVMICFGGSDFKNLTQTILHVVLEFSQFKKIIVITGAAYQTTDYFKKLLASDTRIDHRHALKEHQMVDAMLEADLAIVPSSSVLIEVLAAGCIAISGIYIENQKLVYEYFRNAGYIIDAGDFSYRKIYDSISEVFGNRINQVKFIDGCSKIRVLKLFDQIQKEFLITLRRVTSSDLDLTFSWATNPEVRRFSFQQHTITKSEHTNWFLKKSENANCYYSIVEYGCIPIGSVRFDIKDGEVMISYLLDPKYHRQGFGQLILKKGIEWLSNITLLDTVPIRVFTGEVMKTNIPSIKVFERLGFFKKDQVENYKFEKWI
jgi:UDP-2,4-diacetamido-2,4,6-trideoxy-beta-L-altropyranose hydrolase